MNLWTNEEIEKILVQLDQRKLPFEKYTCVKNQSSLQLLGRGGSANVYEAEDRKFHKEKFAIKVIGFRKQNSDSDFFLQSVKAQKELSSLNKDILKIYKYIELWVALDEYDNVLSVFKEKPEKTQNQMINLRFILMERIPSIIQKTKEHNTQMIPDKLGAGDEREVLKLAYDIGTALKKAHDKNILHRDVKLENVFYSKQKQQYKLGDFGTAKKTEDGFAATIVFTQGYVAPEVRLTDDKYDNTADIYSFGMMLYVIMNNLKFPESEGYYANSETQYDQGYIVPYPENKISEEFYHIISKACMYDADKRYQTMEEMLLDIENLMTGKKFYYKKKHKTASLALGLLLSAIGLITLKLMVMPNVVVKFTNMEYIFLICCLITGVRHVSNKKTRMLNFMIFCMGIYLLSLNGISLKKYFIFLFLILTVQGIIMICLSVGAMLINVTSMFQQINTQYIFIDTKYKWIPVICILLGGVLLYQYLILTSDDRRMGKILYKKGIYWMIIELFFGSLWMIPNYNHSIVHIICNKIFGTGVIDLKMVGMTGFIFCTLWVIRERILIRYEDEEI